VYFDALACTVLETIFKAVAINIGIIFIVAQIIKKLKYFLYMFCSNYLVLQKVGLGQNLVKM
jgi:hypothetical protein